MNGKTASLILPVHNQADHLERVVRSYLSAFVGFPLQFEILLIPNACRDESGERCRVLAAEFSNVRISPIAVSGWGRAVRHGLSEARGVSGD